MRVLVTGGAGYLGTAIVPLLLDRGHEVTVFDRFCFGDEVAAQFQSDSRCRVLRGDIRRLQETPGLFEGGVDAVIHLAGLSNDPSCDLSAEMATDVNVESTRELVSQSVRHGVQRFVFASSCSVYGKGVFAILDELSPTNPVSTYGESKLAAEAAVLGFRGDGFEPVVARPATCFGWSARMRFDVAINQMVASAARQGVIRVFGGGNQWRPFIHVEDCARAFVTLLEAPAEEVSGEIFNIGADDMNVRIRDLAGRIAELFPGVRIDVAKDDDDIRTYRVEFGKFRDRFNFECAWSIEKGCRGVWDRLQDSAFDPFDDRFFNVRVMKRLLATPVDEGGEPMAPHFIPLYKPTLDEREEKAVVDVLRSGWLVGGSKLKEFERAFAKTVNAPHAIGTVSCTASLHLCLAHAGVKPGDEIITSPITWASTANTFVHMGAKPVFADIQPDTLNMDPEALERAVTPRTKAIIPVHLAGQPCDMKAIHRIAEKHGIPVIEDAAHALGAEYEGTPIGSYSDYTCFSFYAIKNITTIEGGIVTTKDAEAADHIRLLASNGMSATAWDRYSRSAAAAPPVVVEPGYKYLMGNVNAAMGLEQLKKFPALRSARERLARMYHAVLGDIDEIALPRTIDGVTHAWHLLIIQLKLEKLHKTRDEIIHDLRRENVGSGVHFFGLHLHPFYADTFGLTPESLPNATAASESIISLPFYPLMNDEDVRLVVDALKKVLHFARK
jgi:dTDP-4-amino-4,6-dideoxygalactose transaminase/nucleoside-diphosphate-sugar epimerase